MATKPLQTTPRWDSLRDAINSILKGSGKNPADLARVLNKPYLTVYQWLTGKGDNPRGEMVLAMLAWASSNAKTKEQRKLLDKATAPDNETQN